MLYLLTALKVIVDTSMANKVHPITGIVLPTNVANLLVMMRLTFGGKPTQVGNRTGIILLLNICLEYIEAREVPGVAPANLPVTVTLLVPK